MLNGDYVFCKSDCSGDNDDIKNGGDAGDHNDSADFESYAPLEQPLDLRWLPDEQELSDIVFVNFFL